MDLKDAVRVFSTENFSDVLGTSLPFLGRITPFSEVTNSGSSAHRRILETTPEVIIPANRVIMAVSGDKYIVSSSNPDFWLDEVIRLKYSILPVDFAGGAGSIGDILAEDSVEPGVYVFPFFVKREIDEDEMSDYFSGYELYFTKVKFFTRGTIVNVGQDYYRLKTDTWIDGAGFSVAQAVKLEDCIQLFSIGVTSDNYNPTTDEYDSVAAPDVKCFVEPLKQDYEFASPSFTKIEPGDRAISVLKSSADVTVGSSIGTYRVISVRDSGDWLTCQCRNLS